MTATQINPSAESSQPAAEPAEIALAEAVQGLGPWLRMLVQAGVTLIPPAREPDLPVDEVAASGVAAGDMAAGEVETRSPEVAAVLRARQHWQNLLLVVPDTEGLGSDGADPASSVAQQAEPGRSFAGRPSPLAPSPDDRPASGPGRVAAGSLAASTAANPGPPNPNPSVGPSAPQQPRTLAVSGLALSEMPDLPDPQRTQELHVLDQTVRQCQLCPELVKNRTQTVFGAGNIRPRLVLMGEAPGMDEDRQGQPMVGASGQLLNKIIAAMKMNREDVYILNAAKCRPPQNRNPTDGECANCRPYWERQLEILRPEVIVCLGSVASKTLLQTQLYVGQLRGTIHEFRGAKVVVTYHPSYLLRTESAKRQTWDDMKTVMRLLNIPV